jgi:hypothetical protein
MGTLGSNSEAATVAKLCNVLVQVQARQYYLQSLSFSETMLLKVPLFLAVQNSHYTQIHVPKQNVFLYTSSFVTFQAQEYAKHVSLTVNC